MKNFFVFNEGFAKTKTTTYILSLQLDAESFSYTIIDTLGRSYAALRHHNFKQELRKENVLKKLEAMFKEDMFLNRNYKAVFFSYVASKSTLIPKDLFKKENLKQIFNFNQTPDKYDELQFNYLSCLNAYNVFSIPSELTTLLINRFPEIIFINNNNATIRDLISRSEEQEIPHPLVGIHFNDTSFHIALHRGGKLQVMTSYSFHSKDDVVYYIANLLTRYGIDPARVKMYVTGIIEEKSEMFQFITRFFGNIELPEVKTDYAYKFEKIDNYLFYNLLNLHNEDY